MRATKTIVQRKSRIQYLLANGFLLSVLLLLPFLSFSQSGIDTLLGKLDPQRLAASIHQKAEKLEEKLVEKSMKTLNSLQKQEEKIYKKMLESKDSLMAKAKLDEVKSKYAESKRSLAALRDDKVLGKAKQYIPNLDSLSTSLKFLQESGIGGKVKDALAKTESLKDKFQQAEEIKNFIKERKEQLKVQLEKLGMVKQLKKINKEVYYYSAQIKEYKEILRDPKKIEKKALELLSKTKIWKEFFRKNSMLASLFRIQDPDAPIDMASFAGLQTRAQVNGLIQQQLQAGGPNARQQLQQNLQSAQSQLQNLKNKFAGMGGGSSDDIMPEGFKPNNQKTKSFLQRLEVGTNMQTQRSSNFFPTTSDMGLSVGYKLNEKSVLGFGASYKLGLGRGWNAIRFTSEGLGLRSFVDWKVKGNFWLSGGYEMNYRAAFKSIDVLRNFSGWQQSGLLGVSKSVPINMKFFTKTKVQLLWDFLSYQQVPRTQPIVFRIGYSIK